MNLNRFLKMIFLQVLSSSANIFYITIKSICFACLFKKKLFKFPILILYNCIINGDRIIEGDS